MNMSNTRKFYNMKQREYEILYGLATGGGVKSGAPLTRRTCPLAPPRLPAHLPRVSTYILRCNKSPIYFGNPLLKEFVSFFVPPKMFHLVYL